MKSSVKSFFKRHGIALSVLLLFILWLLYSYLSKGVFYSLVHSDVNSVINFVKSFGIFSYIIFVLLVILEVIIAPVPPLALYVVAGVVFGGFLGGIMTLTGNIIGALIDFKIARRFGRKSFENSFNPALKHKFDKFFDKYGGFSIFILRINPFTTSDLVSYLSGVTKIKTWKFLLATTLGLIPIIFVQTYLGDLFIKNSPLLVGITIAFSVLYLIIFIYLIIIILFTKNPKKIKE